MKVLIVDQYARFWGGQAVLLNLVHALRQHGHAVTVGAPLGGEFEQRLIAACGHDVERWHLPEMQLTSGRKGVRDALRLAAYTAARLGDLGWVRSFDAVHVNGPRLYLPMLVLSSLALPEQRFLYHVHLDHTPAEKHLIRRALQHRRTAAVIAASEFIRDRLLATYPELESNPKLVVVENALAPGAAERAFVDRFGDRPLRNVAVVGRVSPEKGHDVVIEVAAQVPELEFHLLGDSDDTAFATALQDRATQNVHFHGKVPDVPAALDDIGAQASLVPSQWQEPFGLVAIESMAGSFLTLVSDRGALPSIAARTGAIVFHNTDELVAALRELRNQSPTALAARARDQHGRAADHFAFGRSASRIAALYR